MNDIINKIGMSDTHKVYFKDSEIEEVKYLPNTKQINLVLKMNKALPYGIYQSFVKVFKNYTQTNVSVIIKAQSSNLDFLNISSYVKYLTQDTESLRAIRSCTLNLEDDKLFFNCVDDFHKEETTESIDLLKEAMMLLGIDIECEARVLKFEAEPEIFEMPAQVKTDVIEKKQGSLYQKKLNGRAQYNLVKLSVLKEQAHQVAVIGKIFDVESRETRTGSFIVKYSFSDGEHAIMISTFANTEDEIFKKGICLKVYGNYIFDSRYEKDYVFKMDYFDEVSDIFVRYDTADQKRVEFHTHTNFSEMDGISDVSEYIDQALQWGHPGLVITDHVGVQSFPKAYKALKALKKKYNNDDFKLGYGLEMNLTHKDLRIVSNGNGTELLQEGSYVAFDLETTGLSTEYDHIIEFGAVLIENGKTVSKKQFFIKPPVKISDFTTKLTGITQNDVNHAKPLEQSIDDILDYIKDHTLVAHNALFDLDFLQAAMIKTNRKKINNTVIDTLDLSRTMYEGRRAYRLGSIARLLKIPYDEAIAHRADYDAEVLSLVFLAMLRDEKLQDFKTVIDLQLLSDVNAFAKGRITHLNVIAKNQAGLKNIYELVSLSHTKYLTDFGQPRIIKDELIKRRSNLLIGAGCTQSDIFEIASNKSDEQLDEAISFYDYVEILPLDLYAPVIERGAIKDQEQLKKVLNRIIFSAQKQDIVVIASGDAHYNMPSQKLVRDVYISAQGLGGARHPLYIYDNERRARFEAPDQHFRTTTEMMGAYDHYGHAMAYDLVIKNPKMLLEKIDAGIMPVKDKLYTPSLENSDTLLKEIVYTNANKRYGIPLPEIVSARIERELKSILGHGYGVIYYISHLLVKKSLNDGYLVGSRGSVGSSLVATMAEITEVNPLPPHYVCLNCHNQEFFLNAEYASGFDLAPKKCEKCGHDMHCDGQDIPFETFLGFEGDKVPDIDLNFSGDYQEKAHAYTKEIFGDDYVFKAGTISTVAQKTAFGYVLGYNETNNFNHSSNAWNTYLASVAEGVKRTSGQHPGGIIVVPSDMNIHDFSPIQYPANNKDSAWYTTHFEFHDIDDNVLKLDILGHVDPTAMKLLEKLTGVDINTVPLNDPKVLSLFGSVEALGVDERYYHEITGGLGLPEFGTPFVRQMLEATRPDKFSDLVQISGLSHGTDVWRNNAQDLIKQGLSLDEVIGCRDDIMVFLMQAGLKNKEAFDIMESVRKGRGLRDEWIDSMKSHNVPDWYIDSCLKIKYMFPKAHAVAYVMMAVRIAWFKVYYPRAYYAVYFTLRSNAYEIETMSKDITAVNARLNAINGALRNFETARDVSLKDKNLVDTLEVTSELISRGFKVSNIDLLRSNAIEWQLDDQDDKAVLPPFSIIDGLGANVANGIVRAREERAFISKKDLMQRGGVSNSLVKKLDDLGITSHLQDSNQMSLF